MKKSFYRTLVVAMLVIVTAAANAQFIVKVRPVAPVIVKTVAPSSGIYGLMENGYGVAAVTSM